VNRVGLAIVGGILLASACSLPRGKTDVALWSFDQSYLSASHNWVFRRDYPSVDRLFNAFDYGHAVLYETMLRHPNDARRVEGPIYQTVTSRVLRDPPSVPLDEHAIGPTYTTLIPEVAAMFEWAHTLHRQLYDVLADRRLSPTQQRARADEVLRYYRTRTDLAFSSAPKSMQLMEGQSYSLAFRRVHPKYNGLLWSYHWLQLALYDALLEADTPPARRENVDRTVTRFWELLAHAPSKMPTMMPMAVAVSPRFSEAYPEAAIIFDNLHGLHDVVSDVLATPNLSHRRRRALILAAAAAYRDSTTEVTSRAEWEEMSRGMGVENMGGPAVVGRRAR
jgi:hypothetical protein